MRLKKWALWGLGSILIFCVALAAVSAAVNRRLPTQSALVNRLGDAEKARLAEFDHVRRTLGDVVWPGWGTMDMPIVVYNERTIFLVSAGQTTPPVGWVKVPQDEPRGGAWEVVPDDAFAGASYFRQPLPPSGDTPEAFTVRIGDRWAASMPTMEWMAIGLTDQLRGELPGFLAPVFPYSIGTSLFIRGSDGYISLLAHESFHAYQGTHAPDRLAAAERAVALAESRYPWSETGVQDAWQIELDLLVEALRVEENNEAAALARQFLAGRTARRQATGLDDSLADYERQREWLEGLARYVELEIWRQAALAEEYEPLPAILEVDDFAAYATFDNRWSQELDQIGRMAGDPGEGRFYYSGMAQAVLLDRLRPGWKKEVLRDGVFLENLLADATAP